MNYRSTPTTDGSTPGTPESPESTESPDPPDEPAPPPVPSPETLGSLLADDRRRATLRVLATFEGEVELDALACAVLDEEGGGGERVGDRFERTLVSLYEHHLPLLADGGLLELDCRSAGVFVRPDATRIAALQ
jgi:hypothetical protein